jgi:hypothetical protein
MDARLSDAVFSAPAAPTLGGPGPPAPVPATPKVRTARVRVTSEAVGVRGALGGYYRSLPPWIDDLTREFGPDTYERMQLDDQVSSSLRALCHGVLSDDLVLRPGVDDRKDPDFAAARDAAGFCERATWGQTGGLDQWLLTMVKGAVGGGNRVSETVYRPEESGRDAGRWVLDRLKVKPRRSIAFAVDSCNNLTGFLGLPPGGATWGGLAWGTAFDPADPPDNFLPRDKFCALAWDPPDEDPRGSAILRCVYEPWWAKLQASREWLAYLAQFGSPSLAATTAPGADSSAPTDAWGNPADGPVLTPEQDLANQLVTFRNGGVIVLPAGCTLDVIQSSNAGDAFLKKVDSCDRAIAQGILLAMRAVMQSRFGSRADAEQGQDVAGLQTRYMKRWLARMVTEDLLRPLVRINYGPDAARRLCPYASLSPVEHQDLGASLVAVSGAWKNGLIKNSQLPWVYEQFGMPPATEEELAAPVPGSVPPGAEGGGPDGGGQDPLAQALLDQGPPGGGTAPFAVWDESKHPRGQPENAGEFGPGGGGGAAGSVNRGLSAGKPQTVAQLARATGLSKDEVADRLTALHREGRLETGVFRGNVTYKLKGPSDPVRQTRPETPAPPPAPVPAAGREQREEEAVLAEIRSLLPAHPDGMVPISLVRRAVAAKYGTAAAGPALDDVLFRLRYDDRVRLIVASDLSALSPEDRAGSIQGMGELYHSVSLPEPEGPPGLGFSDPDAGPRPTPPGPPQPPAGFPAPWRRVRPDGWEEVYDAASGQWVAGDQLDPEDIDDPGDAPGPPDGPAGAAFADWEEAKHPRGQPGNAGQFGPGGYGGKQAPAPAAPGGAAVEERARARAAELAASRGEANRLRREKDRARREAELAAQLAQPPRVMGPAAQAMQPALAKLFPEGFAAEDAHALVGAPKGSVVGGYPNPYTEGVNLTVDHPHVDQCSRFLSRNKAGDLVMHNSMFFLKKANRGSGLGLQVFSEEVRTLAALGVDRIETCAGKGGIMNGYYTWPRLGYDAELEDRFKKRLPEGLKGAETVQDLMATPEGREYWKARGYMTGMSFDLKPGSRSLAVLNDYLASKGKARIEVDAAKVDALKARREEARKAGDERQGREVKEAEDKKQRQAMNTARAYWRGQAAEAGISGDVLDTLAGRKEDAMIAERKADPGRVWGVGLDSPAGIRFDAYRQAGADLVAGRHAERMADPSLADVREHYEREAESRGLDPARVRAVAAETAYASPDAVYAVGRAYATAIDALAKAQGGSAPFAVTGPDLSGLGDLLNLSRQEVLDALFDAALDSFDLALPDAAFGSPDQPRLPAGQAGGGEWTSGGGGDAATLAEWKSRAGDKEPPPYDVAGSHAYDAQSRPYAAEWVKTAAKNNGLRRTDAFSNVWYSNTHVAIGPANYYKVKLFLREALGRVLEPYREGWLVTADEAHWLGFSPGGDRLTLGDLIVRAGRRARAEAGAPPPTLGYTGVDAYGARWDDGRPVSDSAPFYSPDQPRVPAGQPGGGRWAGGVSPGTRAARDAASDAVRAFARGQGPASVRDIHAIAGHLAKLTVSQIHALKAEHGLKGSAPNKAALVAKMAQRFAAWRAGRAPEEAVPDWPADYDVFGKRDVFADEPVDAGTLEPAAKAESIDQLHAAAADLSHKANLAVLKGDFALADSLRAQEQVIVAELRKKLKRERRRMRPEKAEPPATPQPPPAAAGGVERGIRQVSQDDIRRVKPTRAAGTGERVRLSNGRVYEYKGISGYAADNRFRVNGWERIQPDTAPAAPPPPAPPPAPAAPERVKPSAVDTPAQGVLNDARAQKAAAWKRVKALREQIRKEPVGGNRSRLRLDLMKAESAHHEAKMLEQKALAAIEARAQELGQTTKAAPSPPAPPPAPAAPAATADLGAAVETFARTWDREKRTEVPFEAIYAHLKGMDPSLTPDDFKALLLRLKAEGRIRLSTFSGPKDRIPDRSLEIPHPANTGQVLYRVYLPDRR